jgi:chemotaxis protein MotB
VALTQVQPPHSFAPEAVDAAPLPPATHHRTDLPDTSQPIAAGLPAPSTAPLTTHAPLDAAPTLPPATTSTGTRIATLGSYLEAFVQAEGLADLAPIEVRDDAVVLSLTDAIGFAPGSTELSPRARPILDEIRTLAQSMPNFGIDIAGHTDALPIRSARFPSNMELSLARAARVARELTADAPDLQIRVVAAGFAQYRPVAPNDDAHGRAQNRRVELRLVPIDYAE